MCVGGVEVEVACNRVCSRELGVGSWELGVRGYGYGGFAALGSRRCHPTE